MKRCGVVVCRYGEVVDVNLVRDKATGKSKGFAFLAYEDQRSTILAVGECCCFNLAIAIWLVLLQVFVVLQSFIDFGSIVVLVVKGFFFFVIFYMVYD